LFLQTEDYDLSDQSLGEQVLNTKELAAKLRCSRPMLYRLMSSGGLPKGFSLGRNRRWLTSEVDCWLREKAQKAQKQR
jgi:excisionase family DNA binding protein